MKSKLSKLADTPAATQKAIRAAKIRLDLLLVERGLAPSRAQAQAMLLAGQVRVEGQPSGKAGTPIPSDARVEIVGEPLRYASRGGLKLEGALGDFGLDPRDKVCADIGSSTGGFTDCLLQHGARKVFAVDVTTDQIVWKLRNDPRVFLVQCNARYLTPENIGEPVDLVAADVSFISVAKILPVIKTIAAASADLLILIKPQFELEKRKVGKGGIVRDESLHREAIERVSTAASAEGLETLGVRPSHLPGAGGNQEYFLHARILG